MPLFDSFPKDEDDEAPKRGRGRPKGSLNKPVEGPAFEISRQANEVYKVIEHMLTEKQRQEYQDMFSGRKEFDPVKHAEFFQMLLGIYASKVILDMITNNRNPSKEAAEIVGQNIKGTKDLEDMRRRREEARLKNGNDDRMADPTRKPQNSALDKIIKRATEKAT